MSLNINNSLIPFFTFFIRQSIFESRFDTNVLDLVKLKGFYPYEYMSDSEKFKEELSIKEKFYSSLTGEKN